MCQLQVLTICITLNSTGFLSATAAASNAMDTVIDEMTQRAVICITVSVRLQYHHALSDLNSHHDYRTSIATVKKNTTVPVK